MITSPDNLSENTIIIGPYWDEPMKILRVNQLDSYIELNLVGQKTGKYIGEVLIRVEDLTRLSILSNLKTFDEEPWKVFLALETLRYKYASNYDPLLAVNISKIDPLPHQIEAVYGYILKLPKIRFLIADDPGAGKTIMAGLVLKELKLRGVVERTLIVAPGHLKYQWQREMKEKFEETFQLVDRNTFRNSFGMDVWEQHNQFITSMDFAKQEEILRTLRSTKFDLVLVDEAHKMGAYKYGNDVDKTARYYLGEVLSEISEHLLFLTATPHKGDEENFRLFLDLLQPGFFARREMIAESISKGDNPLFIRRLKEDLRDFDGKPLFLPRHVKTVTFSIRHDSPEELELYNKLSRYVEERYKMLSSNIQKHQNVAFALSLLQRRFSSSVFALANSLERRKEKLNALLEMLESRRNHEQIPDDEDFNIIRSEAFEEMEEEERWKIEERLERLTTSAKPSELREEIRVIDELIQLSAKILKNESELKLRKLKETLDDLSKSFSDPSDIRILVFTESKDTLDYLTEKIRQFGYSVVNIHGGMSLEQRIEAEQKFKHEAQVLVATEAAGEGINLQFCNLMINYDIPWNPNRLEQRMGRIHRYGQTKEVFIYNFVSNDTREGAVLSKLLWKIEEIRRALGSDKVFDVIGEIIDSKWFVQLVVDAAVNARSLEDILRDIENAINIDEEQMKRIMEQLGESLATKFIDYSRIKEMKERAKENRLVPEYLESFFLRAFEKLGGKVIKKSDGMFSVQSVPYILRQISQKQEFEQKYGKLQRYYPLITFDKELTKKDSRVEFVSFGHPLLEAIFEWIRSELSPSLQKGTTFYDPESRFDGYIFFYEGSISDFRGIVGTKLFAIYVSKDGTEIRSVSPSVIWDFQENNSEKEAPETSRIEIEVIEQLAKKFVFQELEKYKSNLLSERQRQVEIKKKYGLKSLEKILEDLDNKLIELEGRREKGENVEIAITNTENRKLEYERRKQNLQNEIIKETELLLNSPELKSIIRVKPVSPYDSMSSDREIEKIGMKVAMEYERNSGRIPEDVSKENLGYDIRSTGPNGEVIYIEVKARAEQGDILLTQNEWLTARKLGENYYLYVIYNAINEPKLHIIKDPAKKINPIEKFQVVYIVKEDELRYVANEGGKESEQ